MPELFSNFTGREIDGVALTEWVGGTATTAVFRSSFSGEPAAVKLFALDASSAPAELARLQSVQKLSHPNLLRVFKVGRAEIDGAAFLYIVTEFAEENLAQVLLDRALSPEETREVLKSTLDALGYLHEQGFVHSDLKPANILAHNDQLKLSVDSVRHAGNPLSRPPGAYDAPEAPQATKPASDIWSLGMTLVEVLTQKLPAPSSSPNSGPAVEESVPAPFREIAQHCLLRTPELRWSIADIRTKLGMGEQTQAPAPAAVPRSVEPAASRPAKSKRPLIFVVVVLLVAAALVVFSRHSDDKDTSSATPTTSQGPAPETTPPQAATPTSEQSSPAPASENKAGPENTSAPQPSAPAAVEPSAKNSPEPGPRPEDSENSEAVHQVMPDVLPAAQRSITGKVRVKLSLDVDSSGNVTDTSFVSRGPSKYFAKVSEEAARRWKFPPASADSRSWQVEFEYRRSGTTVHSKPQH